MSIANFVMQTVSEQNVISSPPPGGVLVGLLQEFRENLYIGLFTGTVAFELYESVKMLGDV